MIYVAMQPTPPEMLVPNYFILISKESHKKVLIGELKLLQNI